MQSEPRLTPAQQKIEALLGQLDPQTGGVDRDRLMFAAGRASCRSRRPWQAACAVLMLLLGGTLVMRPPAVRPESIPVAVAPPAVPAPVDTTDRSLAYLQVQRRVLQEGLDALPKTRGGQASHVDRAAQETLLASLLSS